MIPLRLDMTAHVRPACLRVEFSNDEDDGEGEKLSFHAYASELLRGLKNAPPKRRCGLTLTNNLESVLAFQLLLSDPFFVSTMDPMPPPPKVAKSSRASSAAAAATLVVATSIAAGVAASRYTGVRSAASTARKTKSVAAPSHATPSHFSKSLPPHSMAPPTPTVVSANHGAFSADAFPSRAADGADGDYDDDDAAGDDEDDRPLSPISPGGFHPLSVVSKDCHSLKPFENVKANIGFRLSSEILREVDKLRKQSESRRTDDPQLQQQQRPLPAQQQQSRQLRFPSATDHSKEAAAAARSSSPVRRGYSLLTSSDSPFEERLVIEKRLEIAFNNGDFQRIPVVATLHLPVLALDRNEIDFGVSFLEQRCQAEVVLFNRSNCDSEWIVESEVENSYDGGETAFSVSPSGGFLRGFGKRGRTAVAAASASADDASFEARLVVSFCPSASREYKAVFRVRGKLGEVNRILTVKGKGSRDEAHVAVFQ